METKNLLWKGLSHLSTEFTSVVQIPDKRIFVTGHIVGTDDGTPFSVEYILQLSQDWLIKSVLIKLRTPEWKSFQFQRNDNGTWQDVEGKILSGIEGCDFVDISLTPLTNTLPIRRLKLKENASQEIKVLYFDLPKGEFYSQRQRYTNKGNGVYRYEGLDTDFEADVEVDDDGFVMRYEGLWEMVGVIDN